MGKYRRVSILCGLIMFPALLFAQFNNNTTSPYSRYGIGDLQNTGYGRSSAMGGAGIGSRYNKQINLSNPASYNAIDSLGFMFEFGVNGKFSNFSNDLGNTTVNNTNFQYMAMNFRISKWMATSLGLTPVSDVGYDVNVLNDVENAGPVFSRYWGVGTISNAFWGVAVEPVNNLSVGANLTYYFGKLTQNSEVAFLGAPDFYNIVKTGVYRVSDFGLDFGAQYTVPLKNNDQVTVGLVLNNKSDYTSYNSDLTQKILSTGSNYYQDTLNFVEEEKSSIEFPLTYGLGFSYVKENKLEINADYYHQSWSDVKFFGTKRPYLTDLNKFAVGAEWIPDKFSIRSYLSKIAYRAGIKYEGTYLKFGDRQIRDFGISFGVGLPIYNSQSTIDVAAEIGRRGTKRDNLMLENYARINVSVNLYDFWFMKRQFE